jgi:ubiquitin carboxyl-terminal hydrolase L5
MQVITNACATLAILNAVMNIPSSSNIQLGSELTQLKEFSVGVRPSSCRPLLSPTIEIHS